MLWHLLAPTVPVINAGQAGIVINDPSPEEYIAADGWFAILGFGFGLVAAVVGLARAAPVPRALAARRGDGRLRWPPRWWRGRPAG